MTRLKTSLKATSFAVIAALSGGASHAATYEYTGSNFTNTFAPFNNGMRISGTLEFASKLTASMPLTDVVADVTAFSFSNGVSTFQTGNDLNLVQLSTDASGAIIGWAINIDNNSYYFTMNGPVSGGIADRSRNVGNSTDAYNYTAGTWALTQVPAPAALPLLAVSLGGLGMFARSRKPA